MGVSYKLKTPKTEIAQVLLSFRGAFRTVGVFSARARWRGLVRYVIEKPSTGNPAPKLTYVMPLPKWGWILCTGIYLEDVEYVLKKVDMQVTDNNRDTMRWIGGVACLGMAVIIFSA